MQIRTSWIFLAAGSVCILIALAFILQRDQEAPEADQEPEAASERQAEDSLIEFVQTPWTGDLDGMLERRLIRILTVPTETSYFLEKGTPRGITAEFVSAFEAFINKHFPPQARHLKVKVVVVPTSAGEPCWRAEVTSPRHALPLPRDARSGLIFPTRSAVISTRSSSPGPHRLR